MTTVEGAQSSKCQIPVREEAILLRNRRQKQPRSRFSVVYRQQQHQRGVTTHGMAEEIDNHPEKSFTRLSRHPLRETDRSLRSKVVVQPHRVARVSITHPDKPPARSLQGHVIPVTKKK